MAEFGFPLETIIIFLAVVGLSLWFDLRMHRSDHDITLQNATGWSLFWISIAIAFYFYLKLRFNQDFADLFFAGYVLEKTLSVDNLMLFVAVFSSFGIKGFLQHRILHYGIIGAVLFRFIFIAVGTSLFGISVIVEVIFALIVAYTGYKMFRSHAGDRTIADYSDHWSVRFTKKFVPVYPRLVGKRFLISHIQAGSHAESNNLEFKPTRHAKIYATPLLLCLICVEFSDIIFAFDSVPAVIAVTKEPLLVYASIVFAILGLRSLYFVLVHLQKHLSRLDKAVAALLFFIAGKLLIESMNHTVGWPGIYISPTQSLMIILFTLIVGVIASLLFPIKSATHEPHSKD